jgi:hypothetical protein
MGELYAQAFHSGCGFEAVESIAGSRGLSNIGHTSMRLAVAVQSHGISGQSGMGFRFHRSVKLFPGLRLNFGKRGISASIGVRGAHVTYGPTGMRTTVGLPGSGLSYTHLEKRHRQVPSSTTAAPPTNPTASPASAGRGVVWLGLIVVVLVVAVGRMTSRSPPVQTGPPPQAVAQTPAQAARATDDEKFADTTNRAALGVARIRHIVANSKTLRLSRVTAMPQGAICYQFHLRNTRGVPYMRTAVIDGAVLKVSGSDGFAALWNHLCAHQSAGRDITSDAESVIRSSTARHLGSPALISEHMTDTAAASPARYWR